MEHTIEETIEILLKKIIKSLYIKEYIKDKDIEKKLEELSNINTKDKVILYTVSSILKYDIISKILSEKSFDYINETKQYIENLNKQKKLRLENIISNNKINKKKLDEALELIKNIEEYYQYEKNKKEKQNLQLKRNTLKEIIEKKKRINKKLEPLISLIAEEIEYLRVLNKPKRIHIKQYIEYKKEIKNHKKRIKEFTQEAIELLNTDKNNYLHNYFYYEESVIDTISYLNEFLENNDFIHIFSNLKSIFETNIEGIKHGNRDINKLDKEIKEFKIINNTYFEEINEKLKTKEDRFIYYIVNCLYKIKDNQKKQELFSFILKILEIIYEIENNNKHINFDDFEFIDYEIIFINSIFENNITEKTIKTNIELYKKIIDLYKIKEEKNKIKKNNLFLFI